MEILIWVGLIILVPFALYVIVRIMSSAWYHSKLEYYSKLVSGKLNKEEKDDE